MYPAKRLKEWGVKQLSVAQSSYKGFDRVMISEPSRKPVPRFYEYLPKNVFKTRDEEVEKFVTDNISAYEALRKEHVTVKFIMMRCNYGMNHRADVEDHTYHTHGMDVSELLVESIIKVNEAEVLVLTAALNFKDLSREGRQLVFDSWYGSCTANGTLTNVENKENAKIQRHKSGALLIALKAALGNDFYQTAYYQLQRDLKEGDNLHMGFQCRWVTFTNAIEEALGPMQNVKRLRNFINTKEHLKGGMSLSNTFYKCSSLIEDIFGKIDVFTTQSDKQLRSNKPTKEFHKFLLAFDVVEALPSEFDKIREELEISIASYAFEPEKFYEEWTKEASENACSKGHSVLYKDKILPQLSQVIEYNCVRRAPVEAQPWESRQQANSNSRRRFAARE